MHDMRELLEMGKGEAPPPPYDVDDLVAAGQRRRRRLLAQRIGGVGVVAVGLATFGLLAVNGIVFSDKGAVTPPNVAPVAQPAAPAVAVPPFTFMFGPYKAGAFRVLVPQEVTTTYQAATIATDYKDAQGKKATSFVGSLTVYRPGVRPPSLFTSGTKVTVNGQPGFANERPQDVTTVINGSGVYGKPPGVMANTLAWQYAANSWAVINSVIELPSDVDHRLTATDERALAEAFRLGPPTPARIPFQAGHLPAGWKLVSISGRSFTAEEMATVTVIFAPATAAATDRIRHWANASDGQAVVITLLHAQSPPPPDAPKNKKTCNHLETDTDLYCSWTIPHTGYAMVLHDPTTTLSEAELTSIAEGLTFADLNQPKTWHPAS
jgi:hypothetical protein